MVFGIGASLASILAAFHYLDEVFCFAAIRRIVDNTSSASC